MNGGREVTIQNRIGLGPAVVDELRSWLDRLVGEIAPETTSLTVRLAGDDEVREANARYRGKDTATDVLSFPGEEGPEGRHLGDVLVSVPTARRQATALGHDERTELEILLLHGVLHCMGYDHEQDNGEMEELERTLAERWIWNER